MDLITQYKKGLEQLKKTKEFLQDLNPLDFDLRSLIHQIDAKINKSEHMVNILQGKTEPHRCGLCDRPYHEDEPKSVFNVKICPICRETGRKYRSASELEQKYGLPKGTIKRDFASNNGKPPKLQKFIDCGLVFKSGRSIILHEIVMDLYYQNKTLYKRRKVKNKH